MTKITAYIYPNITKLLGDKKDVYDLVDDTGAPWDFDEHEIKTMEEIAKCITIYAVDKFNKTRDQIPIFHLMMEYSTFARMCDMIKYNKDA